MKLFRPFAARSKLVTSRQYPRRQENLKPVFWRKLFLKQQWAVTSLRSVSLITLMAFCLLISTTDGNDMRHFAIAALNCPGNLLEKSGRATPTPLKKSLSRED